MLGSSAWGLIKESDFFTWIILFGLFIASVMCVAVIALKYVFFRKELAQMKSMVLRSSHLNSLDDYLDLREEFRDSSGGIFLREGINEFRSLVKGVDVNMLTEQETQRFDLSLNQVSTNILLDAENYLPILGVCSAVAPLVGLFGTIWGLIHSFVSIGMEKSADLAVVAPGIAMALVTTLAGLIVAIPAMIFFHYFSNQLRKLEYFMGHLSDKFFVVAIHSVQHKDLNVTSPHQAAEKTEL